MNTKSLTGVKRATVLLASLCMLISLFAGAALASEDYDPVDVSRSVSLTVRPGSEDFAADLSTANVVVDLYQVAGLDASERYDTYTYSLLAPYDKDLVIGESPDWEALARQAADIALNAEKPGTPIRRGEPINTAMEDMSSGLYLIVIRNAVTEGTAAKLEDYVIDITEEDGATAKATAVYTDEYEYVITPQLVSLPGKEDVNEDGLITTDPRDGEWIYDYIYDMKVDLKMERNIRYGQLEIVKSISSYALDPVTFVFSVKAELGGETVYDDVASFTFTDGVTRRQVIEKIPVGAKVTVKEIYSGASYQLAAGDSGTRTATIVADQVSTVTFDNDYIPTPNHGHGINNHFPAVYDDQTDELVWGDHSLQLDSTKG